MPTDAVVFDIGGVLVDWNPRHLYRQLFDDEEQMEDFLARVCTLEWHKAHDRGASSVASCAELARRHPEHEAFITAWAERSEDMIAGSIDGTVELVHELKARGVRIYVLSNMEPETFPKRLERFDFLRLFDGHVVSGFEGVIKPEPEIFHRLLQRYDLTPPRTMFVDDSEVNIDAATALGIDAVLFESPEQIRRELEARGLLPR